jgi:hypothetical protein
MSRMAALLIDHATHNGAKRNRDATVDSVTSDSESEEPQNKKSKAGSDNVSPVEATTKDNFSFIDTNTGATAIHSTPLGPDTAPEFETPAADNTSPAASLQGLPRELRDSIYGFVAATEEHIVQGRRMVEARRNNSTWTLDECFKQAIALYLLSMTCRQFRDEFQKVHAGASEPKWVLLVNNFDLEQIQIFSDYIQSRVFIEVVTWVDEESGNCMADYEPVYNLKISTRFQMDGHAL